MNTNLYFKKGTAKDGYTYYCTCGHIGKTRYHWYGNGEIEPCDECGTKIYKNIGSATKTCTAKLPTLNVVHSDHSGFEVQRVDVLYKLDIETKTITKTNKTKVRTMKVSYKDNEFYITNEKDEREGINPSNTKSFLKDIDDIEFINEVCSNENMKNLIMALYKERGGGTGYNIGKLYITLPFMKDYKFANVLANMGFNRSFLQTVIRRDWDINRKATKPNEILGIQKYMLKYLKDSDEFGDSLKKNLNWLHDKYGADNVKYMYEISESPKNVTIFLNGWRMNTLKHLLSKGYDFRRLIKYVFADVKYQGIETPYDALEYLSDTLDTAKQIGIELNDKYPKHLRETHDILAMNLRAMRREENKTAFDKYQEEWKKLEYSKDGFSIVIPKAPSDVVQEGSAMSNCVASYVDRVKNGTCTIVFLRRTATKDASEVTLELRGNVLVQAKAFANRNISKDHKRFLEAWAKAKKLVLNY
jgi:hypothetical protein